MKERFFIVGPEGFLYLLMPNGFVLKAQLIMKQNFPKSKTELKAA